MRPSSYEYPLWVKCTAGMVGLSMFPLAIFELPSGANNSYIVLVMAALLSSRAMSTLTGNVRYNDGQWLVLLRMLQQTVPRWINKK